MKAVFWNWMIAHGITAFSYFGIPIVIGYFFNKTKAIIPAKFWLAFFLSGAFILTCGIHHLFAVFEPHYAVSPVHLGIMDLVAFVSLSALLCLMPTAYQIVEAIAQNQEDVRELQRSQQMLRLFLDQGPFAAYIKDEHSRLLYYNQELQSRFLVNPQEWIGKTDSDFLPDPNEGRKVMENDQIVLKTLSPIKLIEETKTPGNEQPCYWLSYKFSFSDYTTGERRLGCISIDITESIATQRTLTKLNQELEEKTKTLEVKNQQVTYLSEMADMLFICDSEDEIYKVITSTCSQLFPQMSGCINIISNSRNYVQMNRFWGKEINSRRVFSLSDCWALRKGKSNLFTLEDTGYKCNHLTLPIQGSHLCVPLSGQYGLLGVLHIYNSEEISLEQQKIAEILARYSAFALNNISMKLRLTNSSLRDGMTGLFNQSYMQTIMEQILAEAEYSSECVGIAFLDIDNFKSYNSQYGHLTANIALKKLANLLLKSVRPCDIVCRWGGEEFVIGMPNITLEKLKERAEQLRVEIEKMQLKEGELCLKSIQVSIGIALSKPSIKLDDLLERANQAMLEAKRKGKNQVVEYDNIQNDLDTVQSNRSAS